MTEGILPENVTSPSRSHAVVGVEITGESFSGPIPPPKILAEYEKIVPGSGDRIIKMAEHQMAHRHRMEDRAVDLDERFLKGENRKSYFGTASGLIIACLTLFLGYQLLSQGKNIEGFGTLLLGIGSLVGAFFYSHSQSKKEENKK